MFQAILFHHNYCSFNAIYSSFIFFFFFFLEMYLYLVLYNYDYTFVSV